MRYQDYKTNKKTNQDDDEHINKNVKNVKYGSRTAAVRLPIGCQSAAVCHLFIRARINSNINTNRINYINSYVNKNIKKTSTSSFEEVKVKEKIEEEGEDQDFNFFWKKLIKDKVWLDDVEENLVTQY